MFIFKKSKNNLIIRWCRVRLTGALTPSSTEAAVVRQFPLFASVLSNGKRHGKVKDKERKAAHSGLTSPLSTAKFDAEIR
jgi:hypothetical protein